MTVPTGERSGDEPNPGVGVRVQSAPFWRRPLKPIEAFLVVATLCVVVAVGGAAWVVWDRWRPSDGLTALERVWLEDAAGASLLNSIARCQSWRDRPTANYRELVALTPYEDLREGEADEFFAERCSRRNPALEAEYLPTSFGQLDPDIRVGLCERHADRRTRETFEELIQAEIDVDLVVGNATITVERTPLCDLEFEDFDSFLELNC